MVQHARLAMNWIQSNRILMKEAIDEPWVVSALQEEVETFVDNRVARGASYEDIRDNIVFNFNDSDDLRLFIKNCHGLNLRINATLFGTEYLRQVLHDFDDA